MTLKRNLHWQLWEPLILQERRAVQFFMWPTTPPHMSVVVWESIRQAFLPNVGRETAFLPRRMAIVIAQQNA